MIIPIFIPVYEKELEFEGDSESFIKAELRMYVVCEIILVVGFLLSSLVIGWGSLVRAQDHYDLSEVSQAEAVDAELVALSLADVGESITWRTFGDFSGGSSANGVVTITKDSRDDTGAACREYRHVIGVSMRKEETYGTACLTADGDWKVVKQSPWKNIREPSVPVFLLRSFPPLHPL